MDDVAVVQFVSFTSSTPERAAQYLRLTDGDIQQAIDLYFVNDGNDPSGSASSIHPQNPQAPPVPSSRTRPPGYRQEYEDEQGVVHLDSDPDDSENNRPRQPEAASRHASATERPRSAIQTSSSMTSPIAQASSTVDDDEAMARRLQEEFYTSAGAGVEVGPGGIRAPLGRTTETLVGPGSFDVNDEDEMRVAVMEQMRARQQQRRAPRERPGIFNQATARSIWNNPNATPSDLLAQATAGALESSSKSNLLAEMYRPPHEIMSHFSWDEARGQGKDKEKWILVNIQDPAIFDCQVLNRDIWKYPGIMETVRENFIFMQYVKGDPRGSQYIQYYFQSRDSQDAYPHIAIVDPRTGEQVKVWSGAPVPKATEFLMQLHEFLDRYSLNASAKNPVARRKPKAKKETQVEKMTEEQMLEMALQNSLAGTEASRDVDPDDLTRSISNSKPSRGAADEDTEMPNNAEPTRINGTTIPPSSYTLISSSHPHSEPPPDTSGTTRIQFRHPMGRVVRRFALTDPVRRVYEWLKASPLEGKEGVEFELIFLQKNLLVSLEETIEQAGLKNGTVMVEFLET